MTITYKCEYKVDHDIVEMMDLMNTSVLPFIGMFILSIALIVCVYRSRSRINSNTNRDNRFAISAISLNIMFFVLTCPIVIYYMITYQESILNRYAYLLYYSYYGLGFYMQIIVNRDFRNEFLSLINLKVVRKNNNGTKRTNNDTFNINNQSVYLNDLNMIK